MKLVAHHLDCDIRQSILALQYWIITGAKRTRNTKDNTDNVSMETGSVSRKKSNKSRTDGSDKNCDDLESKLTLIGEYYSCARGMDPDCNSSKGRDPDLVTRYEKMLQGEAVRHDMCLECIMGVCNVTDCSLKAALQVSDLKTKIVLTHTHTYSQIVIII